MRVLVTGASGFIGRHVVAELLSRGHVVRAATRSAPESTGFTAGERLEVVRVDLRTGDVSEALDGVDAVVHLAARLGGGESQQFQTTVVGTERLLDAMAGTAARRLVLASSYAVYDWDAIDGSLTEASPIEQDPYPRGPYTVAKVWQERIARDRAGNDGIDLTVLRPGFVWGSGHTWVSGIGPRLGGAQIVFGLRRLLPLTYVENCAIAFADATTNPLASGETFNVVDDDAVTAWRYAGEHLSITASGARRLPLPYPLARSLADLADALARRASQYGGNLPDYLVPVRFAASYKPLRFPNDKLRRLLGWRPRWTFDQALARTRSGGTAAREPDTVVAEA